MPPSPSHATVSAERAAELAEADLNHIARLTESEHFTKYFVRRLQERRQRLRELIADDDSLDDQETRTLRRIVKEYDSLLRMPEEDRQMHTQTLRFARIEPAGPSRG